MWESSYKTKSKNLAYEKITIEKKPGLMLTVSALSYKTTTVKVDEKTSFLEIKLKDDSHKLGEVVVKSKKGRYKRKDNPAVELMRREMCIRDRGIDAAHEVGVGEVVHTRR